MIFILLNLEKYKFDDWLSFKPLISLLSLTHTKYTPTEKERLREEHWNFGELEDWRRRFEEITCIYKENSQLL